MSDKGPNEDYYEINIKHKAEIELYKEGVLIGTQNYLDYCWIDCSDDIILSEGNIASDDFMKLSLGVLKTITEPSRQAVQRKMWCLNPK